MTPAAARDADRRRWRQRLALFTVCYLFALPLGLALLAHRRWIRRRPLPGLRAKLSGRGERLTPGQVLVHGVSLGEVNLMRTLVPRLEQALGATCLLTTTTQTGRAALDEQFPDRERAFLPLDLPWAVERFLARTRPRLLVLLELEVWPALLCACHARGIPVALVNAKIGERSFRGYRRAGALLRPLFAGMSAALAQNPLWAARLVALGVPRARCRASGSLKADMVRRADGGEADEEARRLGLRAGECVLLLASTSAGAGGSDEEARGLAGQLPGWRERGWRVVICPRHPERGEAIAEFLRAQGAQPRRSSLGERLDGGPDEVLIVDEIGRLGRLYAWTAAVDGIAIVGGSLGSGRRGQNMLEAAAAGCCTVVGWDTGNFPDAMALLRDAGGVVELGNPIDQRVLAALSEDPERRRRLGRAAQRAWLAGQGATARTVDALARLVS